MMTESSDHYAMEAILFLEEMWGDEFLSPGGPEEVQRLLNGIDLTGKTVVDIGSGAGGVTILLAGVYGAEKVIGLDVVFSKDSIVHIADKESLAADVYRVLRPGGWFVAADWLISHDEEPSPEMADYIAKENLGFGMASPARYKHALLSAGFTGVELTSRNLWYREELARLEGPVRTTPDS